MNDFGNGAVGFVGCLLSGFGSFIENLPQWVTVICSVAIAIVTCGLQIYRMIKNRDKPVEKDEENENEEDKDDTVQR